jgi:Ca2+-binding RTX toxin-like protein
MSSNSILSQAQSKAQNALQQFAQQPNFVEQLRVAFGNNFDVKIATGIANQLQAGDFSLIPELRILSNGELGSANGAFAADINQILVSADFLSQHSGDINAITELVLEEIGHKFDRLLNASADTPGDEGAIFRLLATGQALSPDILAGLRAADDRGTITLDTRSIPIEKQDFYGTPGNDTLIGTGGDNDIFYPGTGADLIDGGAGIFDYLSIRNPTDTADTIISDFNPLGGSILGGSNNGTTFTNIEWMDLTTGSGNDIINLSAAQSEDALRRIYVFAGAGNDTIVGSANSSRTIGGRANSPWQSLWGEDGNDNIIGGSGEDYLYGGTGDDIIAGLAGDDTLDGGEGNDTLDGGDGNDSIYGGSGNDSMIGGKGDDTYDVDSLSDITIEKPSEGIDFVNFLNSSASSYTLGDNVEHLRLYNSREANTGTGNSLDNALYGNQLNDTLMGLGGDDYLYGGLGTDSMIGGLGDDIYDINTLADIIVEQPNEGIDLVYTSVSGSTLGDNVERLYLYGSEANTGTGNSLANALYGNFLNDTLSGLDGIDYIYGGLGNDSMIGGKGDDIYDVDSLSDIAIEISGAGGVGLGANAAGLAEGNDLVYASISGYTLAANIERLQLYTGANSGNGNELDNLIQGNQNDDTLNGGAGNDRSIGGRGNDVLTGGSGNDTFFFGVSTDIAVGTFADLGIDTITDFTVGQDKIELGGSIFTLASNNGVLGINDFAIVSSDLNAASAAASIVYNSTNGHLIYNANQSSPGFGGGGQFAQLATGLNLTNNDFIVTGSIPLILT